MWNSYEVDPILFYCYVAVVLIAEIFFLNVDLISNPSCKRELTSHG